MAIIRNSASALRKGRVGNTTYYVSGQRQIARVSQNSSNYGETARRTEAMQERRARWGNLVNFYKISKHWMKYAYETKTARQSDYNRFMQVNLNSTSVYLTKDQAALGACIVEPFAITQGSLRPINVTKDSNFYTTDIEMGNLVISDTTTVGAFSNQVIALNNGVKAGYQLSFISYQQWDDLGGVPQVTCTAYEVTLDPSSEAILRDYLPEFCSTTRDSKLGTSLTISAGCFAYIWSVTENGSTRVSTQTLINNNAGKIASFSSPAQRQRAIESYGLDNDSFLMSGSTPQVPTPGTQSLSYIWIEDVGDYHPGNPITSNVTEIVQHEAHIFTTGNIATDDIQVYLVPNTGAVVPSATATLDNPINIRVTWPTAVNSSWVKEIRVVIDGVTYTMQFTAPSAQNED